jgi:hypothetical protein
MIEQTPGVIQHDVWAFICNYCGCMLGGPILHSPERLEVAFMFWSSQWLFNDFNQPAGRRRSAARQQHYFVSTRT